MEEIILFLADVITPVVELFTELFRLGKKSEE